MRCSCIILGLLAAAGCQATGPNTDPRASHPQGTHIAGGTAAAGASVPAVQAAAVDRTYEQPAGGAAALVFSGPGSSAGLVDRDGRGLSAFLGYQSPVVSYQFTRTEDTQGRWGNNWLNRRAISVRVDQITR